MVDWQDFWFGVIVFGIFFLLPIGGIVFLVWYSNEHPYVPPPPYFDQRYMDSEIHCGFWSDGRLGYGTMACYDNNTNEETCRWDNRRYPIVIPEGCWP